MKANVENVEMEINIALENPFSQTLQIEYVNESDRSVRIEKLNPHTNIKIYNSEKQLIEQIYGSFVQGIPSYFELDPHSKMQHEMSLSKNYDLSPQGSYYLTYKIDCECLESGSSDASHHFCIKGTTKIRFDEGVAKSERKNRTLQPMQF